MKKYNFNYAETFARTKRSIDSDWGCRPFLYEEIVKLYQENGVGGLILDIGGGEAKVSRDLRDMGFIDPIITLDNNSEMLNRARIEESNFERNIEIIQGDALDIPLADNIVKLGLRVLVDGHWNTNQIDQANQELSRILKDDGLAIVAIPDPYSYMEQLRSTNKNSAVEVRNESLLYINNQDIKLTLRNLDGKSVDILAKMHTVERYRASFLNNGFKIVKEFVPKLNKSELFSYKEAWGCNRRPFEYRIFILDKLIKTV